MLLINSLQCAHLYTCTLYIYIYIIHLYRSLKGNPFKMEIIRNLDKRRPNLELVQTKKDYKTTRQQQMPGLKAKSTERKKKSSQIYGIKVSICFRE